MAIEVSPSESTEENLMRPSSSRGDNNRRQGQDFLGYRLQLQGSPSENLGESPRTGNKGTSNIPTKPPDERTTIKIRLQERRPPRNSGGKTRAAPSDKRHLRNPKSGIIETIQIGHV